MSGINEMLPPYYAVIFTSQLTESHAGYEEIAERMVQLARKQPGFLGMDSVREGHSGITVSYWKSEEAIASWKANMEHEAARVKGRASWYKEFHVQVAKVERSYAGP